MCDRDYRILETTGKRIAIVEAFRASGFRNQTASESGWPVECTQEHPALRAPLEEGFLASGYKAKRDPVQAVMIKGIS